MFMCDESGEQVLDDEGYPVECLDGPEGCTGTVEWLSNPWSSSSRAWPRCTTHADAWLDHHEGIANRYPVQQPENFDPMFAGERWDEDY
jgi:hypothetical protein